MVGKIIKAFFLASIVFEELVGVFSRVKALLDY